jgi:EpsI family protein
MKPILDKFTTRQTDRRKFLVGLLFCTAAGIAAWRKPRIHLDYLGNEKLDDFVPKSIGRWNFVTASGLVVPTQDPLAQSLYSQVLTRVYSDGQNPSVMLLLAQNGLQDGFIQVHRPENCYTANGYQVSAMTPHPIQLGSKVLVANSMDASAGGQTEHIIYWTRVGSKIPATWKQQKIAVAEQNLEGIVPDAILVRVSCVDADGNAARAAIDAFIRAMIVSIPPNKRPVFII